MDLPDSRLAKTFDRSLFAANNLVDVHVCTIFNEKAIAKILYCRMSLHRKAEDNSLRAFNA